jgi:HlyD family secretion protein
MKKVFRILRMLAVIAVIAAGLGSSAWTAWQWYGSAGQEPLFRTDHPVRGSLVATITATGTIEPEEVIDVGAQVAGQILAFGQDPTDPKRTIDYGSQVEQGTVLARIDDSLYAPEVDIARADLGLCTAEVRRMESELVQMRAKLYQSERDWERAKRLGPSNSISQTDFDTMQNTWETSKASVPAGEANVEKARRAVEKARGTLVKAEKNLGYCTIKSPVKGVIIDRRVNVGQTVVSSLNAPSLFLIAKDLRRLQVWVSVNEADIGDIYPGQYATFTVDAYPADVFHGIVGQVRLNATMTQNVVTYTVVVNVDNEDGKLQPYPSPGAIKGARNPRGDSAGGKLLPYLTANVQFKVDERSDALLVPNAALRYRPQVTLVAPEHRAAYEQSLRGKSAEDGTPEAPTKERHTRATVWMPDGEYVRPVKVRIGLTDGMMTEVVDVIKAELFPESTLVTGENQPAGTREGTVNPFGPQTPRRR